MSDPPIHSPFAAAFTPGTRLLDERGGHIELSIHALGPLHVPGGSIAVADPFTTDFADPPAAFHRRVVPGSYPVELAIAHFSNADQRVACARVRLTDDPVLRWEPAWFAAPTDPGDPDAYGVDAGMGCFFDPGPHGPVDDSSWLATAEAHRRDTWTWLVAERGPANIVMFSSGWGDGLYPSYWGLAADDRVAQLVTDFEVLLTSLDKPLRFPLPLRRGRLEHPLLRAHDIHVDAPLLSRTSVVIRGRGHARVELSDGAPVAIQYTSLGQRCTWKKPAPGTELIVRVLVGLRPCTLA